MNRLLSVQVLSVLDTETEEVAQLGGGVNFGLPGVLALTVHGQGHDIVAVLGGNQVGRLEEDAGTFSKRSGSPRLAGLKSGVDGGLDIRGGGMRVCGQRSMGSGVGLCEGFRALDL